jgi:hypothetical protein
VVAPVPVVEAVPVVAPVPVVEAVPVVAPVPVVETPVPPPTLLAARIGAAPLPFAPARLPATAAPASGASAFAASNAGETTSLVPMITAGQMGGAEPSAEDPLPFRRADLTASQPGSEPIPNLTLEAYASVRALCSAAPDRRREVLARYGIHDSLTEARLDARWRKRFEEHPAEADRYAELFAHYRDWFDTHGDPSLKPV